MREIELLAPAGSYETMEAALAAGADAVYIGGTRFGARAYADNPDQDGLLKAIDYVHLHGKKLYLTINTLFKEQELTGELYPYLLPYYRQGLDAVIVQDLGVVRFIRERFPDLPIHASTQMTVTGAEGAALLESLGVQRVVTARELSLKEIRAIREKTDLEIESFVHGALCYCYSGQCLFSSILGGRSGNRGRCAQPCRLPYEAYEGKKRINDARTSYVLSPKDMCTVEILPQILQAGVTSLKIEGRMKKPEYTAGVVSVYRKYLDRYRNDPAHYRVEPEDLTMLYDLYNRDGFNQSYYQVRNGKEMMALRNEKKKESGEDIRGGRNEELFAGIRRQWLETKKQEKIKGYFTVLLNSPAILTVQYRDSWITVEKDCVSPAASQPVTVERLEKQMKKTGNTPFWFEELEITLDEGVFVPMQAVNELRREALEQLEAEILSAFRREVPEEQEQTEPETDRPDIRETEGLYALAETDEQLEVLLQEPDICGIYADISRVPQNRLRVWAENLLKQAASRNKKLYLALPHMVRNGELDRILPELKQLSEQGLDGFLVRNLESFSLLKRDNHPHVTVRLDHSLYTMNSQAQKFWKTRGAEGDTIPLELNSREIRRRDNTESDFLIYGYLPMMVSAQCVKKNLDRCTKSHATVRIKDRKGKYFSARCYCEYCYNVIYNSLPYGLAAEADEVKKLGACRLRLNFTMENAQETRRTVRFFADRYLRGITGESTGEYTKGHYKRGIE